MDYKKLYEEALERAREFVCKDNVEVAEYIFPELKESEDERIRKWIIGVLSTYEHDRDLRNAAIAWLEKQGEKKPIDYNEELKKCQENPLYFFDKYVKLKEQNLAWSEEDECYMSECIGAIATKDGWSFEEKRKTKHWLKSLKDRVLPKSQWKPSDEQIGVIEAVINNRSFQRRHLDSLYADLKKLREK